MELTEKQLQVTIGALHVAAERYRKDAEVIFLSTISEPARKRLVDQFNRQADECSDLLLKLESE